MKKVLLAVACGFAAMAMSAQVWVGGTLGVDVDNTKVKGADGVTSYNFTVAPEVGYSFNESVAVAVELGFNYDKPNKDENTTTFAVTPYLRYTFVKGDKVNVFGELTLSYLNTKPKGGDALSGFGVGLRPGISVALSDNLDLVGKMNLINWTRFSKDSWNVNNINFSVDFTNVSLGIAYKF